MPRDQAAVPISVILLVGLTVAVTGAATTVILIQEPSQEPVAAGFMVKTEDRLEVLKTSGEALDAEPTRLYIGTPQGTASLTADEVPGIGETWANGKSVCLAGEGPRCLQVEGAEKIVDIRIAHGDQTLYNWDGHPDVDDLEAGSGPRLSVADDSETEAPAAEPDLRLVSLDSQDPEPEEGEPVTFEATVANVGAAPSSQSTTLQVDVGDETHDTLEIPSLEDGESTTLTTDAWTAEGGQHAITALADPEAEIQDARRDNNAGDLSLAVGTEDPGHAYEDVDNDAMFTAGTDVKIPDEEIRDGEYHVQDPWSLVVPSSVDPIDADHVRFSAGSEGHVVLDTDVASGDEGLRVEAGAYVQAEDVTLESEDESIVLEASDGPVDVDGATLHTSDQRVELYSDGDLEARGATLTTDDERVIVDVGGTVDLTGADVDAPERIPIAAGGDVTIDDASLSATEEITIDTVEDAIVRADGTHVSDEDDTVVVTPDGAAIQGTPAEGDVAHEGSGGGGQGQGAN